MRASELVSKALDIAEHYDTLYVMGCFGAPLTGKNVERYLNNHPYNRKPERQAMIRGAADREAPVFGFDCVCLIKAILWGWTGDPGKTYGGAAYNSGGVPDLDANQMLRVCTQVSTDFRGLVPGAAVWMPDHIGIYAGDGRCVECSPKWDNAVQITQVGNLTGRTGYKVRTWSKWGLLPYIDYEEGNDLTQEQVRAVVREELEKLLAERDGAAPAEQWQRDVLAAAVEAGVSDGSRPMALCTRLEAMGMAANVFKQTQGAGG